MGTQALHEIEHKAQPINNLNYKAGFFEGNLPAKV